MRLPAMLFSSPSGAVKYPPTPNGILSKGAPCMAKTVTICAAADIPAVEAGIGRAGRMLARGFPLDTGIPGVGMEFSWTHDFVGLRHAALHPHLRPVPLCARRAARDPGWGAAAGRRWGFYPEGVHYGPQLQTQELSGLGLQFMGPAVCAVSHARGFAQRARQAEGRRRHVRGRRLYQGHARRRRSTRTATPPASNT